MTSGKQQQKQLEAWAQAIRDGNRRDLARAITLVESTRPVDVEDAQNLLELLLPATGNAIRIGISGVPGVGKSTFIDTLGKELVAENHNVAVLAIDPSSPKTGGSILGDKTRMPAFTRSERAFVRPSPAGKTLGGVARKSRESMLMCEAAGFDVVLVETVGVGQAEWHVAGMVDMFVVLMLPNAGDALQGMKRGIMEMADAILVNKADNGQEEAARRAVQEYRNALEWSGQQDDNMLIRECSGLRREVVRDCWKEITDRLSTRKQSGMFHQRRNEQLRTWVRSLAVDSVLHAVQDAQGQQDEFEALITDVQAGKMTPLHAGMAFRKLVLDRLTGSSENSGFPV